MPWINTQSKLYNSDKIFQKNINILINQALWKFWTMLRYNITVKHYSYCNSTSWNFLNKFFKTLKYWTLRSTEEKYFEKYLISSLDLSFSKKTTIIDLFAQFIFFVDASDESRLQKRNPLGNWNWYDLFWWFSHLSNLPRKNLLTILKS